MFFSSCRLYYFTHFSLCRCLHCCGVAYLRCFLSLLPSASWVPRCFLLLVLRLRTAALCPHPSPLRQGQRWPFCLSQYSPYTSVLSPAHVSLFCAPLSPQWVGQSLTVFLIGLCFEARSHHVWPQTLRSDLCLKRWE